MSLACIAGGIWHTRTFVVEAGYMSQVAHWVGSYRQFLEHEETRCISSPP